MTAYTKTSKDILELKSLKTKRQKKVEFKEEKRHYVRFYCQHFPYKLLGKPFLPEFTYQLYGKYSNKKL